MAISTTIGGDDVGGIEVVGGDPGDAGAPEPDAARAVLLGVLPEHGPQGPRAPDRD